MCPKFVTHSLIIQIYKLSENNEMKKYLVHYTYIGFGAMEIEAKNKIDAQRHLYSKPQSRILKHCKFDDGVGVDLVERIKSIETK